MSSRSLWVNTLLLSAATFAGGCSISPSPLSELEMATSAAENLSRVAADQEPIARPVDLYEAMARALKYNLDHKVELRERALRVSELDLAHYNMLPNVVANSGYAGRNNDLASSSFNLVTNTPNFGASTSQDRRLTTGDLTFSWNILDFGLSYVRAHQAADKALIAEEQRRKVTHRIMEDVRTAFWRAVSSERLIAKLQALEARTRRALTDSRSLSDSRTTSPVTALTYQRELVEIKRTTQDLQRELSVARWQLAALMNVAPGTRFALAVPARGQARPHLAVGVGDMIQTALTHRSELRDVAYRRRINSREADAALLELLPGLQVFAGSNHDSNSFLSHHEWLGWGAKASWNLLKVFQYPAKSEVVEAQDKLLDQRTLALTMAVMTQVHVSRARFLHLGRDYETAREYLDVQQRLIAQMRTEARAERVSEQTLIREEMNTLVAEAKLDIAFSALQSAYANIYAAIGVDPVPEGVGRDQSVGEIAGALKGLWFERGDPGARIRLARAM